MGGADFTGTEASGEGAGIVGLRQSLGQGLRVRDGAGDLLAGGRLGLVPVRIGVPDKATVQPGLQPRAANITYFGRREEAQLS